MKRRRLFQSCCLQLKFKPQLAENINLTFICFIEVDIATTDSRQVLSVVCLQHHSAIGLIVDCKMAEGIWGFLLSLNKIDVATCYSAQIFSVVCLQQQFSIALCSKEPCEMILVGLLYLDEVDSPTSDTTEVLAIVTFESHTSGVGGI